MTENHNPQRPYTGQPSPPGAAPEEDPLNEFSNQQPVPVSQGAVLGSDTPSAHGKHSAHGQSDSTSDTKEAAKEEGQHLKDEAGHAAENVQESAQQEAGKVTDEAKDQASSLWDRVQSDVSDQASTQQNRAAQSVRAVSDDLANIRRGEAPQADITRDALSYADEKVSAIADRLENAEPRDLVEDVRRFATRKPLAFLGIAAGAGLVIGRLTRGLTDSQNSSGSASQSGGQRSAASPNYGAGAGQGDHRVAVPPEARTHESDARTYGGDPTGYAEYGIPESGRHARPGTDGNIEYPEGEGFRR